MVLPGGAGRRPFSEALLGGGGDSPGKAVRQIILLAEGGFPPPNRIAAYELADDQQPRIHRWKVKPTCWRLYFHADSQTQRLILLHATCKKRPKANEQDAKKARDRLTRILQGDATIEEFQLPPN